MIASNSYPRGGWIRCLPLRCQLPPDKGRGRTQNGWLVDCPLWARAGGGWMLGPRGCLSSGRSRAVLGEPADITLLPRVACLLRLASGSFSPEGWEARSRRISLHMKRLRWQGGLGSGRNLGTCGRSRLKSVAAEPTSTSVARRIRLRKHLLGVCKCLFLRYVNDRVAPWFRYA